MDFTITGNIILLLFGFCQGQSTPCTVSTIPVLDVRQSSTYQGTLIQRFVALFLGYSPFSANNGIDGKIVSGDISGSCAQTLHEIDPWWQAQLDGSYYVTSVVITAPKSCNTCPTDFNLENILIEVGEVSENYDNIEWNSAWIAGKQNCSFTSDVFEPGTSIIVNCIVPRYGNYVRLSVLSDNATTLSICEVEVVGSVNCTYSDKETISLMPRTQTVEMSTYVPSLSQPLLTINTTSAEPASIASISTQSSGFVMSTTLQYPSELFFSSSSDITLTMKSTSAIVRQLAKTLTSTIEVEHVSSTTLRTSSASVIGTTSSSTLVSDNEANKPTLISVSSTVSISPGIVSSSLSNGKYADDSFFILLTDDKQQTVSSSSLAQTTTKLSNPSNEMSASSISTSFSTVPSRIPPVNTITSSIGLYSSNSETFQSPINFDTNSYGFMTRTASAPALVSWISSRYAVSNVDSSSSFVSIVFNSVAISSTQVSDVSTSFIREHSNIYTREMQDSSSSLSAQALESSSVDNYISHSIISSHILLNSAIVSASGSTYSSQGLQSSSDLSASPSIYSSINLLNSPDISASPSIRLSQRLSISTGISESQSLYSSQRLLSTSYLSANPSVYLSEGLSSSSTYSSQSLPTSSDNSGSQTLYPSFSLPSSSYISDRMSIYSSQSLASSYYVSPMPSIYSSKSLSSSSEHYANQDIYSSEIISYISTCSSIYTSHNVLSSSIPFTGQSISTLQTLSSLTATKASSALASSLLPLTSSNYNISNETKHINYSSTVKLPVSSSVTPVWCPCTCEQAELIAGLTNNNKTSEEVAKEIEEALIELTVDAKTTVVNERKLVSVGDKRDSAKIVGTAGMIFCSVILILIVVSDLPVLVKMIRTFL